MSETRLSNEEERTTAQQFRVGISAVDDMGMHLKLLDVGEDDAFRSWFDNIDPWEMCETQNDPGPLTFPATIEVTEWDEDGPKWRFLEPAFPTQPITESSP